MEKTLLIIKPDAVSRNLIGEIVSRVEKARFKIKAMKMVQLKPAEARRFYVVHEGKPFLDELVAFMSSGPVVPMVLEKENAVAGLRKLIGATDPAKADPGTVRHDLAIDMGKNSVHGSDSPENAKVEIEFFFPNSEGK
ncbi:MAG TPA: nucleoside-diphosphate kinase [candidate division Zixibacteria bacterium]|nr:nucleoside-diphosphate kinase [candidate division Zixibacteria bacterium]